MTLTEQETKSTYLHLENDYDPYSNAKEDGVLKGS